jgi:hypothetical protein
MFKFEGLKFERKVFVRTKYFWLKSKNSMNYPNVNSKPNIMAIIENQLNA